MEALVCIENFQLMDLRIACNNSLKINVHFPNALILSIFKEKLLLCGRFIKETKVHKALTFTWLHDFE